MEAWIQPCKTNGLVSIWCDIICPSFAHFSHSRI